MKCSLEENSRLFDVLSALKEGYETGDFQELFPYLSQDCVMESQWVLTPNTGYETVVSYFTGKGDTLAKNGNFPSCSIVELIGNNNPIKNANVSVNGSTPETASVGLLYTPGKLCLLMEQTINGQTNGVIVDVKLDEKDMVKRIDLCMPELFKYRDFYTYVGFYPVADEWNEENYDYAHREHFIRVSEPYYDELYLFMQCAGLDFDEYDDLHIPMDKWCEAMNYWNVFAAASNYDEAFESIAGVDYEAGTVKNPTAARQLGRSGKRMWDERPNSKCMLAGLLEWTALYKDSYSYINTCGW